MCSSDNFGLEILLVVADITSTGDFSGGPVAGTLSSQGRGPGFRSGS